MEGRQCTAFFHEHYFTKAEHPQLQREGETTYSTDVVRGPPSGVRASGNWLFFVREFVKMKKVVREFVKTISFVIRENKKYGS